MINSEDDWNVAVHPPGVDAVKVTVPLKRWIDPKCRVDVPCVPAMRYMVVGEADTLKFGFRTVIVNVIELAIEPCVPVTVTVCVPEAVPLGTEIVTTVELLCA